mmetsp:Transcript_55588/g.161054  ORF Transcript_55588/g.161054 Transcript_55588/m.161054 type:complete len:211 (+) Transcript_55588:775-1407(+)
MEPSYVRPPSRRSWPCVQPPSTSMDSPSPSMDSPSPRFDPAAPPKVGEKTPGFAGRDLTRPRIVGKPLASREVAGMGGCSSKLRFFGDVSTTQTAGVEVGCRNSQGSWSWGMATMPVVECACPLPSRGMRVVDTSTYPMAALPSTHSSQQSNLAPRKDFKASPKRRPIPPARASALAYIGCARSGVNDMAATGSGREGSPRASDPCRAQA